MLRYLGPFVFLASIPALYYSLGPTAPLATVGLLLASLIGAEFLSPRGDVLKTRAEPFGFRALLYLYILLQLGVTIWATGVAAHAPIVAVASLALSVGVAAGVFGMLAAHEMVHSKSPRERLLGVTMLSGMTYRHFRVAHVFGHHRRAATVLDSATARLGESFYAFLPRTLVGQFLEAFHFERKRCAARRLSLLANRVVQDVAVTIALFGAILVLWGAPGLVFFVAQSAVAIVVLEMFNYIAHYGLERSGRQALDDRHSWNSSNVAANLLIFNMGRHSYHHRKPSASYEGLQYLAGSPELPAGYAASILLALVPPLWHRVMDPRARAFRLAEHEAARPAV